VGKQLGQEEAAETEILAADGLVMTSFLLFQWANWQCRWIGAFKLTL